MKASIIIPVKNDNKNLRECISKCLELDYPDFEIIVLPDHDIEHVDNQTVKSVPTGDVGPSRKRDIGMGCSDGQILAFIDDDSFPVKNWLREAIKHFDDEEIAAVGGPAVTPKTDSLRQKASGLVYSSFLGGGKYTYRYLPKNRRNVDDYPSCNFIVRRSVIEEIGGFRTDFWPGEDTHLCLEITKKRGKKIMYDPHVLIFHHRRPLFFPHLKQIARYALHRGYFAKKFPQTSLRFSYFVPPLFIIGLMGGGLLSLCYPIIKLIYIIAIALYLILALLSSLNRNTRSIPLVFLGILSTHLCYGVWFIKGLLSRRLQEEK